MSNNFIFKCSKLQKCFESVKPILDDRNEVKNFVSDDIKNLEKYFKFIKLDQDFELSVTPVTLHDEELGETYTYIKEDLVWDKELMRLMFRTTLYHTDYCNPQPCDTDPTGYQSIREITIKPLIENSYLVRKKIIEGDYLIKLLSHIAKEFDIYKKIEATI